MLTPEQILSVNDAAFEMAYVPEWKGEVRVGVMTGEERDQYEAACYAARKGKELTPNIRAMVCIWTLQNPDGTRMFTMDQLDALAKKSGVALDRVYAVAERINGLTKEALDSMVKNSESGQSE